MSDYTPPTIDLTWGTPGDIEQTSDGGGEYASGFKLTDAGIANVARALGIERYLYAEFCRHENVPATGDRLHVGGEPSDLICLASPLRPGVTSSQPPTEPRVVVVHTGNQDDMLRAHNEGFAEAMRQMGEPDDGGAAMREYLAAHDAELTAKVRADTLEEAATMLTEKAEKYAETALRLDREKEWDDGRRYHAYAAAHHEDAAAVRALAAPENRLYPTDISPAPLPEQEASDGRD